MTIFFGDSTFYRLKNCLCCNSNTLHKIISLGIVEPANQLIEKEKDYNTNASELSCNVCLSCWHMQLGVLVNPKVLFRDYVYRTGVSKTLTKYYEQYPDDIGLEFHGISNPTVLDIGCNDGTLLGGFKNKGWKTVGVDFFKPEGTESKVDKFIEAEWGNELSNQMEPEQFDLITATNVLAHSYDPKSFIYAMNNVLKADGRVVIEFPYGVDMIRKGLFDTIYHEHVSYFTAYSIYSLIDSTGFCIDKFNLKSNVHGGSVRLTLKKCKYGEEKTNSFLTIAPHLDYEKRIGVPRRTTYSEFESSTRHKLDWLNHKINDLSSEGFKVVAFGASAKSTVVINAGDLKIDYIVDETQSKIGKLSPGKKIPIFHPSVLQPDSNKIAFLITAWNCMEECIQKIKKYRNTEKGSNLQDIVITYIPEITVGDLKDA